MFPSLCVFLVMHTSLSFVRSLDRRSGNCCLLRFLSKGVVGTNTHWLLSCSIVNVFQLFLERNHNSYPTESLVKQLTLSTQLCVSVCGCLFVWTVCVSDRHPCDSKKKRSKWWMKLWSFVSKMFSPSADDSSQTVFLSHNHSVEPQKIEKKCISLESLLWVDSFFSINRFLCVTNRPENWF